MMMIHPRTLAALAVTLAGVIGFMGASAQDDLPSASVCNVFLQRDQPDGIVDVTRQVLADGSCNCVIHTGSERQGAAAEARVARMAQSRSCPAMYVMQIPAPDSALSWLADGRLDLASVLPAAGLADPSGDGIVLIQQDIAAGP